MIDAIFGTAKPRVFGHRGAAGLAPENTLPSFALALALGADVLELDVHGTRDGAIVALHDATLERTTEGRGPVCAQTLVEVQQLDAGYRFTRDGTDFPYRGHGVRLCTLEDVLRRFPLTSCNIEVKQAEPSIVDEVIGIVRRFDAQRRVILAAEQASIMEALRKRASDISTSFSAADVATFVQHLQRDDFAHYEAPGCALQIPPRFGDIELITPELVDTAHRFGLEVHAWTINDRDEMLRLLRLGIDGIMSDFPGLARAVLAAAR
jgi:glycerophosphoryl diester phosphodiesterase